MKALLVRIINGLFFCYNFLRLTGKSLPRNFIAWLMFCQKGPDPSRVVGFDALKQRKRSDTIFIFGSGSSLAKLDAEAWREIGRHNTLSFNYFFVQDFVDIDFHLLRELGDEKDSAATREALNAQVGNALWQNPRFSNALFVIQNQWSAYASRRFMTSGYLPPSREILFFRNAERRQKALSKSFGDGLTHGPGTLTDCINLAYLAGFRKIVLAGVDLNDRRYFWMIKNTPYFPVPGVTKDGGEYSADADDTGEVHRTAHGIVTFLEDWKDSLAVENVTLSVLNPESLLATVLPVHNISG